MDTPRQVRFDPTEKVDCPFCPCDVPHEGVFTLLDAQGRPAVKMCLVCFANLSFDMDKALEAYYPAMRGLLERIIRQSVDTPELFQAMDVRASAEVSLMTMGVVPEDPSTLSPAAQHYLERILDEVRIGELMDPPTRPEPETETPAQAAERLLSQLGLNWHKDG